MRGKHVIVTRAPHQAGELADVLRTHGADVLLYPCIAIVPPEDTNTLDDALREAAAGGFDWLVLTSANTVEALRQRCEALGLSLRGIQTAAVGPATAASARELLDISVQLVPEEFVAEALAAEINLAPGARVFLPQADIARSTLHDQLSAAGVDVTAIAAYRTVIGQGGVDVHTLLKADALTFTSSSTVENCVARVRSEGGEVNALLKLPAFCIGPQTADTARGFGFAAVITAEVYTLAGMVETMAGYFGG
jgi:uroporphyrinogen-III synthase